MIRRRTPKNRLPRTFRVLRLEDRVTPAIITTWDPAFGALAFESDANDPLVIGSNSDRRVTINGSAASSSTGLAIEAREVKSISVFGGPGNNLIDLSDVDPIKFAALYFNPKEYTVEKSVSWTASCLITGGGGADTITGSQVGDYIECTSGADVVTTGRGQNTIRITNDDISSITVTGNSFGHDELMLAYKPKSGKIIACDFNVGTGHQTISYDGKTLVVSGINAVNVQNALDELQMHLSDSTGGGPGGGGTISFEQPLGMEFGLIDISPPPSPTGAAVPGRLKWTQVVCKRGITSSMDAWKWRADPSSEPLTIECSGLGNTLAVNTFGYGSTTTPSSVQVAGMASVSFTGMSSVATETRLYDAAALIDLKARGITITPTVTDNLDGTQTLSMTLNNNSTITGLKTEWITSIGLPKITPKIAKESHGRVTPPGKIIGVSPGAGVQVAFEDNLSRLHVADVAAGVLPDQTIKFAIPDLAPGQSSTNSMICHRTASVRNPYTIIRTNVASCGLSLSLGGSNYDIDLTDFFKNGSKPPQPQFAAAVNGSTGATPTGGATSLIAATPNGSMVLVSSMASGIDSAITTMTAGAHLYIGGRMVDVATDGHSSGNAPAGKASMSTDGRYIAFESFANNLVDGLLATPFTRIFVRDMLAGRTFVLPHALEKSGIAANGATFDPKISWDGRSVSFLSSATNLVPGVVDTNNEPDLFTVVAGGNAPLSFAWDFGDAELRCVSLVPNSSPPHTANRGVVVADMNRDGNTDAYVISYLTAATDAGGGGGGSGGMRALTKVNKIDAITIKQSAYIPTWSEGGPGTPANTGSLSVSMDGSAVVLWTDADVSSLIGKPDTNGVCDILRLGVANGGVECMSLNYQGAATADGASPATANESPSICWDASLLAFSSTASNLIEGLPGPATDGIYQCQYFGSASGGKITVCHRVDKSGSNTYGGNNHDPAISADGFTVVWLSPTNYQSGGTTGKTEAWIWRKEVEEGKVELVSGTYSDQGVDCNADVVGRIWLTGHGDHVYFTSTATDLIPGDTNGQQDVFVSSTNSWRYFLKATDPATIKVFQDPLIECIALKDANGALVASSAGIRKDPLTVFLFGHSTGGNDTFTIDYTSLKYKLQSGFIYATQPSSTPKIIFTGGMGPDDEMEVNVSVTPGSAMSPSANSVELTPRLRVGTVPFATRAGMTVFVSNAGEIEDKSGAGQGIYREVSGIGSTSELSLSGTAEALVFSQSQGAGSPPLVYKKHHGDYLPAHNFKLEIDGIISGGLSGLPPTVPANLEIRGGQLITLTGMNGGAILDGRGNIDPNDFKGAGNDTMVLGVGGGTYQSSGGKYKLFSVTGQPTPVGEASNDKIIDISSQIDLNMTDAGHAVVINLDSTTPQPYIPGRTLQVNAPITNVAGTPFDDFFNIKPLTGTPRYVDGGAQVSGVGDRLVVDAQGKAATLINPGQLRVGQYDPIFFSDIEQLAVVNQAPTLQVAAVEVNDGTVQRSRVTSITLGFNALVSFPSGPAAAISLTDDKSGATVTCTVTPIDGDGFTRVVITFPAGAPEYGSLPDGKYTLHVLASQVSSAYGQLDGNGDGIVGPGGEDYASPPYLVYRLFGDGNADRIVNQADFIAFRNAFNNGPSAAFDFEGNDNVTQTDFIQFRNRFNVPL